MIVPANLENLEEASRLIASGELVAFPTETVYGLGANATDEAAVAKIFELKGRPDWNPLIVHLSSIAQVRLVANLDALGASKSVFFKVADFWPGPLSIVLPKSSTIPKNVSAGLETVAVRIPKHPIALALIQTSDCPIAAPSANRFMTISPTSAQHVADSFGDEAPYILDGGPSEIGLESTVLDLTSEVPRLLRPGGLSLEAIEAKIGKIDVVDSHEDLSTGAPSPGMALRHYSPKTKLCFVDDLAEKDFQSRVGLIAFSKQEDRSKFAEIRELSLTGDLEEAARNLFSTLRELDELKLDLIAVERCEEKELGRALMDRLRRATTNQ